MNINLSSSQMKNWAKAYNINSSKDKTLNSLSIILLVAFHLQVLFFGAHSMPVLYLSLQFVMFLALWFVLIVIFLFLVGLGFSCYRHTS